MNVEKEIRIMHACELGAVGVYRGHKCVARYFFRRNLEELDNMRFHEKDHASIFKGILHDLDGRTCYAHKLFFIGGLFYGVLVGLLGVRAIGVSTYTIENIVNDEFDVALTKLEQEKELSKKIKEIQLEELEHRDSGKDLAGSNYFLEGAVARVARMGAYTAKHLAAAL